MRTNVLTQQGNTAELVAWSDGAALVFTDLLKAEACASDWRIVEVWSDSGKPFELRASWSGGEGGLREAHITVSRGSRFAVYARSLTLRVANLANAVNRVACSVADGYCVSSNQCEVRSTGVADTALAISVPPFATHLRVDCGDSTQFANITLVIKDGVGVQRVHMKGDEQPAAGVALGSVGAVEVTAPAALRFRTIYTLSI